MQKNNEWRVFSLSVFSALGDVAMTIPVVHSLAVQYPQLEITVLSRAVWQPLFQGLPANVSFIGADLTGKHKGLWGLNTPFIRTEGKSVSTMWRTFIMCFGRNTCA